MIGKVFVGIIAFIFLVSFATPITDGITTWRTNSVTQAAVVTTGAAQTTANVTLSNDLYLDDAARVSSISSNITESPVATSYVAADDALLVSALAADDTRTLTIIYLAETDDTIMRVLGPFLPFLIFGGCAGGILYAIYTGFKRR